jgi:hypothetical protein
MISSQPASEQPQGWCAQSTQALIARVLGAFAGLGRGIFAPFVLAMEFRGGAKP